MASSALKLLPLALFLLLVAACASAGPAVPAEPGRDRLLSESQILRDSPLTSTDTRRPVEFPRDDAPHSNLTEWWYYTGHLQGPAGEQYGFEFVIFQSTLGGLNVGYASHFAITDLNRRTFSYDERVAGLAGGRVPEALDLNVGGWTLAGSNGFDRFAAAMADYALTLETRPLKPPVLHDGDGIITFGPPGDSYYYSRTRLAVSGTLVDHGRAVPVTGEAWMDHQWGDYLVVGGGGWDWFSAQLDDFTELTVSVVHDGSGAPAQRFGTLVLADGGSVHLRAGDIELEASGSWRSPRTGIVWPSGWRIRVPERGIDLTVTPEIEDQELDTRASTGIIYWEGSVRVRGVSQGRPVTGRGYVELTGYSAK